MTIAERIKDILGRSPTTALGLWVEFARQSDPDPDPDTALERLLESGEIIMGPDEVLRVKDDPNNEDLVELTLTVRLPRATADAIRRGEPYRVEPVPAVPAEPEVAKVDPDNSDKKPDPDISNKPKRPTVIPRPWSEFADAGMFWFVNRLLHVFGWVICRETEPDGTISGVYPARTRWRGFPEKDETEGFRKVTADIQAHMTELVEDCQD